MRGKIIFRKNKFKRDNKIRPPISKRFCMTCQEITTWKYDKPARHSRCKICGGCFSRRPTEKELIK